jgi:Family of unknown function (DUF5683)
MKRIRYIFYLILFLLPVHLSMAQLTEKKTADSIPVQKATDTTNKKKANSFDPRKATFRSAVIPGWGQIYNKKYWKLPLVYGALGTTAAVYFYNVKTYRELKLTYIYKTDTIPDSSQPIDPRFSSISANGVRSLRNSFRQNVDYAVLFFILFWGLNVVDATVDAHLKAFDVSDELSLDLKPGYSPLANTTGISLVLNIGKRNSSK